MRRLMAFDCAGVTCGATLDDAPGGAGVLMMTGGSQTRTGSHRMSERLGAALAAEGTPVFRFDRRGVGDSGGEDPGYRDTAPDIISAAAAFRAAAPGVGQIIGLGLCDGASALALFGADADLDGLILVNPWLVEAGADAPPPQAIRAHYGDRLTSLEGWRKLLTGGVSYRKLLTGLSRILRSETNDLAADIAVALEQRSLPIVLILARKDMTAMAAESVWASPSYRSIRERAGEMLTIDTDSHTFARPGDDASLLEAVRAALTRLRRD